MGGSPHSTINFVGAMVTVTDAGGSQVDVTVTSPDVPKANFEATWAPDAYDDSSVGYSIGSRWIDITADGEYVMLNATVGDSVWKETTVTVYGSEFQSAKDDSSTSTQSTSYVTKFTLTTTSLVGGDYAIDWSTDWIPEDTGKIQILMDGTTSLSEHVYKPGNSGNWVGFSGFDERTLSAATHTFEMQYLSTDAGLKTHARNARIKLYRVS